MKSTLVALSLVGLTACVSGTATMRKDPVNAKIAIQIEQNTIMAPSFDDSLAGELRQAVLDSGNGVPVTDAAGADLVLKVVIRDVNFTQATAWEWQLVDPDNSAIVLSKNDSAAFGIAPDVLAAQIVGELNNLDLKPYAEGSTVVAAQTVKPAQTGLEPRPSSTDGANAWAVIVGVENYRESLATATGAEKDAEAFAAFARTTLNVPEANIKLLKGERASRSDMTAALMEWLPRNAVKPGGKVYVYFSGHGAPDVESGSAYLLPYDANPTYVKSGGLRVSELQDTLAKLNGQQTYVFLDACFSGSGERSVLAEGTRPLVPVKEVKATGGVVVFSASKAAETTGAHAGSGHGLFTYHLLSAINGGADANGDRNVSIAEMRDYLTEHVSSDARRDNREQTPTVVVPSNIDAGATVVQGL